MHKANDNDDLLLWNQFKNGDEAAFALLFRQYYAPLLNYGRKMTTDLALVEDCIQELFAELWKTQGKADVQSVKAYIFKAFKFKLLRMLTKSNRVVLTGDEEAGQGFVLSYENTVVNREENAELAQKINTALQHLTPRQREIIYLRYFLLLEYDAISEIMQVNYQAARNLSYQAIKVLKQSVLLLLISLVRG